MLRIFGTPKRLCDGLTRRDMLHVGSLATLGVSLPDFFRHRAFADRAPGARVSGFGHAKSCILLFLYGSPSQIETFDVKPEAPTEVRGEFRTIPSSVPGYRVGELLPQTSKVMHLTTVLRSVTHPYPIHGVAYATTGVETIDIPMELNPRDPRHYPYVGSVVEYLSQEAGKRRDKAPDNIALPWPMSSRRVGEVARAGPYAAFLGGAFHPKWTEFRGEATRSWVKTLQDQRFEGGEPYMGITPESRFELATATELPVEMTLDRFDRRRNLLEQLDDARRDLERSESEQTHDRFRRMAYDLIQSGKVRDALAIQREPRAVRESYGMTLFGQSCLAARRLIEAGSRFVTVFWDEYGLAGSGWDTHWNHFARMKEELCPGFDMAFAGLLRDLDQRGLLDETLVVCLSEHGRTPKISSANGGGRDHWSQCYSVVLAGGGVRRGCFVGRSDRLAATVAERPISPKDILATIYHLLGFDPESTLTDRTGRPVPLVHRGSVIAEAIG
jgi:hypothetical protein